MKNYLYLRTSREPVVYKATQVASVCHRNFSALFLSIELCVIFFCIKGYEFSLQHTMLNHNFFWP